MNPSDSFVFWSALYFTPLVWVLLGLSAIFKPQYLLIGHSTPPPPQPTASAGRTTSERDLPLSCALLYPL